MRQPTQSEIKKAKEYLVRRLDAQNILEGKIDDLFDEASERISLIVQKYKNRGMKLRFTGTSAMAREIDEVISWLRSQIDYNVDLYSTPSETSDELSRQIMDVVYGEDHGSTYEDRRELYLSRYRKGLAAIAWEGFEDDMADFMEAISEESSSVIGRMMLLAVNSVAVGYAMNWLFTEGKDARGFYSIRGSSYPCDMCDEMVGYHPIEEYPNGQWHPRCKCLFIFI